MHELADTEELVNIVVSEAQKVGKRVKKVKLLVGAFSTFQPYAINFYYETLKKSHEKISESELEIEVIPGKCICRECGGEFEVESIVDTLPQCPKCGAIFVDIVAGKDFLIDYMEVEDEGKNP